MTEKEFRKLVTDLEVPRTFKESVIKEINNIFENLNNNLQHVELVKLVKIGSFAKSTMLNNEKNIDVLAVFKYNLTKSFKLINQLVINKIINEVAFLYDSIVKTSDINVNQTLNFISFNINDLIYNIYIRYENNLPDIEFINSDLIEKHNLFVELANKDYTYFKNTSMIIKYFRNEQKINISGHIIEVLLYYSLNEYFKDNRYETYLNAFIKGIDDFLKQKEIKISSDILEKLNIEINSINSFKGYSILDPTNISENLVAGISEIKLGEYRRLKKALSKLVDVDNVDLSKEQVTLNINPKEQDNQYIWSYEIMNSRYHTEGGSFEKNEINYIAASLKALSKGLKAIVDSNLCKKQVKIVSKYNDILSRTDLLSAENNSRRKTIIAYIEVNNITIAKN